MVSELFSHIPPIQGNQLVPHIEGIFLFVELVGSIPFRNRALELRLGVKWFHSIPPHSRTEQTLTNRARYRRTRTPVLLQLNPKKASNQPTSSFPLSSPRKCSRTMDLATEELE
jgi:hypothetical protein